MARAEQERPVVRLLAVNRSEVENAPHPLIGTYRCLWSYQLLLPRLHISLKILLAS